MPRRDRWDIVAAVLGGFELERDEPVVRITRIAAHANLPFDRLQLYVDELRRLGLLAGDPPRITARGQAFLADHRHWLEALAKYGFADDILTR